MKIKTTSIVINQAGSQLLDIIQWVHQNNKKRDTFSISFELDEQDQMRPYLKTDSVELIGKIANNWPHAVIEDCRDLEAAQ
jgi:hypothetical protein